MQILTIHYLGNDSSILLSGISSQYYKMWWNGFLVYKSETKLLRSKNMKKYSGKDVKIKEIIYVIQFLKLCVIFRFAVNSVGNIWCKSQDSSVGVATGCGLVGRRSISGMGNRFFFSPQYPDRLWSPLSLLSMVTRGSLPRSKQSSV
jgi:hypothetical protein